MNCRVRNNPGPRSEPYLRFPHLQSADRQDNLYRACAFQPDRQGDDGGQNQASAA